MRRPIKLFVLSVALLAVGAWHNVWAAESRASLLVSATVLAHASIEAIGATAPVLVTAADLERGYLDITRTYRLRTNAPRGALLQLNPRVGLTRRIDVAGFASPVQIHETNVEVLQPASDELQLRFRLWLQPAATAGEYPLPVQLAALAI